MTTDPIKNLAASVAYTRKVYGVSDEAMEYRRRRGPDKIIEPTKNDWALYGEAIYLLAKLDQNDSIYLGPVEIDEPETRREPGEHIETENEWIARVARLIEASNGNIPEDLDRALTVREFKTIFNALRAHEQNGYGA